MEKWKTEEEVGERKNKKKSGERKRKKRAKMFLKGKDGRGWRKYYKSVLKEGRSVKREERRNKEREIQRSRLGSRHRDLSRFICSASHQSSDRRAGTKKNTTRAFSVLNGAKHRKERFSVFSLFFNSTNAFLLTKGCVHNEEKKDPQSRHPTSPISLTMACSTPLLFCFMIQDH